MREIYFLLYIFSLGLAQAQEAQETCEDYEAAAFVSGYNRNLTFYVAINGTLQLCQNFRVDLNMSWLAGDDILFGIHEVEEFQGQSGGAVGRFDLTDFGYQRLEWVSVGAGNIMSVKIFHCKG